MPSRSAPHARPADPVRLAAVRAYVAFRAGGAFRPTAPDALREKQQRRLYTNLLRGMVRHSRRLEAEAARLAKRPAQRLSAPVMGALVLGLYQLFELRQAEHAAVFETVALLGALGQSRAKGLVNAVLRGALRERAAAGRSRLAPGVGMPVPSLRGRETGETSAPVPTGKPAGGTAGFAERTSHPDWLVDRWVRRYGAEEAERICEANNRFESSGVRVNQARIGRDGLLERLAREGMDAEPHPSLAGALLVPRLGALLDSSAFAEGLCYVQDAGSQALICWIAPLLRGWVLDACCAPGGKLTHMAEFAQCPGPEPGTNPTGRNTHAPANCLSPPGIREQQAEPQPEPVPSIAKDRGSGSAPSPGQGSRGNGGAAEPVWLVGLDLSAKRLRRVRENFRRLRLDAPPLVAADGRRLPFRAGAPGAGWNTILLDAPCSATGMIRKYPELKWRRHAEDLQRLCGLQRALLDAAAPALAPQGRIVYVTCSLEPEENEEQVEAFLARTPGFRRRSFRDLPPPRGMGDPTGWIGESGDLCVLPDSDRMGLYAAILEPGPNSSGGSGEPPRQRSHGAALH